MKYYILKGKIPVETSWEEAVASFKQRYNRDESGVVQDTWRVGEMSVELPTYYHVSTVFLGIDHSFRPGKPLLFETMVFTPDPDWQDYQERYSTWSDAEAGHARIVEAVRNRILNPSSASSPTTASDI